MDNNCDEEQTLVVNHIEKENYTNKEYINGDNNDDDDDDDSFDDDNIEDGYSTPRGHNEEDIHKISKPKYCFQSNHLKTREQNAIATLLSTFGENIEHTAENFIKQNIGYKDLSALTKEDFELLGIINERQQEELLNTFSELPKQSTDYKKLITSENTKNYNNEILSSSSDHLKTMKTAISATNLKLKIFPTEDDVIDEEEFASTYILQTMDELRRIVDEIDDRVAILEEITEEKSKKNNLLDTTVIIAGGITIVSLIYFLWRRGS